MNAIFGLLMLGLLCAAGSAQADWVFLTNSDEADIYVDGNYQSKNVGASQSVWTMLNYFEPAVVSGTAKKYRSALHFNKLDCVARTSANLAIRRYTDEMGRGPVVQLVNSPDTQLASTTPSSLVDTLIRVVCDRKPAHDFSEQMLKATGLPTREEIKFSWEEISIRTDPKLFFSLLTSPPGNGRVFAWLGLEQVPPLRRPGLNQSWVATFSAGLMELDCRAGRIRHVATYFFKSQDDTSMPVDIVMIDSPYESVEPGVSHWVLQRSCKP